MIETTLKEAGLTDSEVKVYLALLEHGDLTKTPLVKFARISGSKVYEIIQKLENKGLVSTVIRNKIKTFHAAPPLNIKNYLETKKKSIDEAQANITSIIPQLLRIGKQQSDKPQIEVFSGWDGLESAYMQLALQAPKNKDIYVIGASAGFETERTLRFFIRYADVLYNKKKLKLNVIFKKEARAYAQKFEEQFHGAYKKKFLFESSLAEVTILEDKVLILSLQKEPFVIRIINKQCADLFLQYFHQLWKLAQE